MKYITAVVILISGSLSVSAREPDRLMLRWSSFPGHVYVHEFYLESGKGLYIIRDEGKDRSRDKDFPSWAAFTIDSKVEKELADAVNELVNDSKGQVEKLICDGTQWGADVQYGKYDVRYITRCGSIESYEKIRNLVENTVQKSRVGDFISRQ